MRKILCCFTGTFACIYLLAQTYTPTTINEPKIETSQKGITCITRTEIEGSSFRTLAELLNTQAGIVVNGAYQPLGSLVNIYMEGTLSGRVTILLDGIPVWDPSSISAAYFDLNFIPLEEIEQINIYHGAQSSELGDGALVGIINIITRKKNATKPINIKASQSFGNETTSISNIQLWGKSNKFTYSTNYSRMSTTGFPSSQDTTGNRKFYNDGFHNNVINSRIEYLPTSDWTIKAYNLYSQYRASTDIDAFFNTKDYYYINSNLTTGTGFNYHKRKLEVFGNYQYGNTGRGYHYDNYSNEHYGGNTHFTELYIKAPLSKHFSFLAGTDYRHCKLIYYGYDSSAGKLSAYYPTTAQYSLHVSLSYSTTDSSFNINLRDRLNRNTAYGYNNTFSVEAAYIFKEGFQLFARVASGYLTPSVYQLYDNGVGNNALGPEQSITYQAGIEQTNAILKHKILLFYRHIDNMMDYNYNTAVYSNYEKLKSWGVEYETKLMLFRHLSFNGNYTFLVGRETTISRQNYTDTITYPYLIRRPKHIVNAGINYEGKRFMASITGRWVSNYYDVDFGANDSLMKSYILLGLSVSYSPNSHLKGFMDIQNILDNRFIETLGLNTTPFLIRLGFSILL
jgi:vitamin B12 transporter